MRRAYLIMAAAVIGIVGVGGMAVSGMFAPVEMTPEALAVIDEADALRDLRAASHEAAREIDAELVSYGTGAAELASVRQAIRDMDGADEAWEHEMRAAAADGIITPSERAAINLAERAGGGFHGAGRDGDHGRHP